MRNDTLCPNNASKEVPENVATLENVATKSTLSQISKEIIIPEVIEVLEKTQVHEVISEAHEVILEALEVANVPNNEEISIYSRERWNSKDMIIDDIFTYCVATQISEGNDDDIKPHSINECQQRIDWPK